MVLTVTRPIEQAVMEVPGIRRVRSTTFRGATEISAQFEPATDMVVALQQVQNRVAELRADLPRGHRAHRRAPDAGGVSRSQPQPDRAPVRRRTCATTPSTSCGRRSSRVPGVGQVEVLASDTREIEVVADPADWPRPG